MKLRIKPKADKDFVIFHVELKVEKGSPVSWGGVLVDFKNRSFLIVEKQDKWKEHGHCLKHGKIRKARVVG